MCFSAGIQSPFNGKCTRVHTMGCGGCGYNIFMVSLLTKTIRGIIFVVDFLAVIKYPSFMVYNLASNHSNMSASMIILSHKNCSCYLCVLKPGSQYTRNVSLCGGCHV